MITDANNIIIDVNPAFTRITGYQPRGGDRQEPEAAEFWPSRQGVLLPQCGNP